MSQLKLAVGQFGAGVDPEVNLATCVQLIAHAGEMGSDLIVLPESSMYSDPLKERPGQRYAEPLDGNFTSELKRAAREHGLFVVAGITETSTEQRPYNTAVVINSHGELVDRYRKIHLFDAFGHRESDTVMPGEHRAVVFDVNHVRVGVQTCYDIRFPEMSRYLADHGAELVVVPTSWTSGPMKELHWETLIRARAIENTMFVAGSGQSGPERIGSSVISDPMGVFMAHAGTQDNRLIVADIDTDRITEVQATNPSALNRRFDTIPRQEP